MSTGSPKRIVGDLEAPQGANEALPLHTTGTHLDATSIAALRVLFELLEEWDQQEKTDED